MVQLCALSFNHLKGDGRRVGTGPGRHRQRRAEERDHLLRFTPGHLEFTEHLLCVHTILCVTENKIEDTTKVLEELANLLIFKS